jgi:hypothetical protein
MQPQTSQLKRPSFNPMLSKGILPGLKNPSLKSHSLSGIAKPSAVEIVVVAEEEPECMLGRSAVIVIGIVLLIFRALVCFNPFLLF